MLIFVCKLFKVTGQNFLLKTNHYAILESSFIVYVLVLLLLDIYLFFSFHF